MIIRQFIWPADITLQVLGGKWKAIILYHVLRGGPQRFGELKRRLPGISVKMLSKSLRELEFDGLLHKLTFAEVPPRTVYTATDRSRSLLPVLESIYRWGQAQRDYYGEPRYPAGFEFPAAEAVGPAPGLERDA